MRTQVILDTGPLVALMDARDRDHRWAVARWKQIAPPLLTCEAVISEACFLLDRTTARSGAVLETLARGAVAIGFRLDENLKEIQALRAQYEDVPMSLADASLVRMAELRGRSTVFTLDRDFTRYRKHRRYVIPLLMPDAPTR